MRTLLIVFFYFLISVNALSSDCKTISKYTEYYSSDYVFIGEIIIVKKTYFDVKVNEVFKGKINGIFRVSIDDYSILPNKGETWLFYSVKDGRKNYVRVCGWSRNFNFPLNPNSDFFPEPPDLNNDSILNCLNEFRTQIALYELRYDILSLRQLNIQKELSAIREEGNKIDNNQLEFLKFSFIFLIVFILLTKLIKFK